MFSKIFFNFVLGFIFGLHFCHNDSFAANGYDLERGFNEVEQDRDYSNLPPEIWNIILSHISHSDLKNIRATYSGLKSFSSQILIRPFILEAESESGLIVIDMEVWDDSSSDSQFLIKELQNPNSFITQFCVIELKNTLNNQQKAVDLIKAIPNLKGLIINLQDFSQGVIGDEASHIINLLKDLEFIKNLQALKIRHISTVQDTRALFRFLEKSQGLKELCFEFQGNFTEFVSRKIVKMLKASEALEKLRFLSISGTSMVSLYYQNEFWDFLSQLKGLQQLKINHSVSESKEYFFCTSKIRVITEKLKNMLSLKKLSLNNLGIKTDDAIELVKSLKNLSHLTHLDLSGICFLGNLSAEQEPQKMRQLAIAFGELENLEYLNLGKSKNILISFFQQLGDCLNKLEKIRYLNFSFDKDNRGGQFDAILALNIQNIALPQLTTLILQNTNLNDQGAEALSLTNQSMPNLRILDLSYNQMSLKGFHFLGEAIKNYPHLEELFVNNMNMKSCGLNALSKWFWRLDFLKTLDVNSNDIDSVDFCGCVRQLRMENLIVFDIGRNIIKSAGLFAVIPKLADARGLKRINLEWNELSPKGFKALAKIICRFQFLKEVKLNGNNMGNRGLSCILPKLQEIQTVRKMDFSNCELDDQSIASISEATSQMSRLDELDVKNYPQVGDRMYKNHFESSAPPKRLQF